MLYTKKEVGSYTVDTHNVNEIILIKADKIKVIKNPEKISPIVKKDETLKNRIWYTVLFLAFITVLYLDSKRNYKP